MSAVALAEKLIPIVPSYVLLLFLGMTTVTDANDLVLTMLATTLGSTLGGYCWYRLGRAIGAHRIETLVSRFGRYIFLSQSLYERMTQAYVHNQFRVTLIGQLIPTVRIYLALPAGVLGVAVRGFLVATMLGALAWNAALLTLGYALRHSDRDPVSIGLIVITGLVASELTVGLSLWARSRSKRSVVTNLSADFVNTGSRDG